MAQVYEPIQLERLLSEGTPAIDISVMQWEQKHKLQLEMKFRNYHEMLGYMHSRMIYTPCALCKEHENTCVGCPIQDYTGIDCNEFESVFRAVTHANGPKRFLHKIEKMLELLRDISAKMHNKGDN